ncbi:bifunctional DNA-formamidopyrimidine glycosylase/DNA-(apurinic or apyrimidinic site) lyase [Candidatus Kuenenbacteria bacterium]|nr:bifunctional DNA-formamidopyrimidine glycosylase/DNA-(apurinic or apyrimidinic site) lyase [Candidatus Kuenenbacteria bacterium]
MPELPEVETIVNDLKKNILKKKISGVEILKKKIVRNSPQTFKKTLVGDSFQKIFRRGKYIFIELKNADKTIVVHLRMTGQLIYQKDKKIVAGGHSQGDELEFSNKHTHVIINFKDKSQLFYNDVRQFGFWQLISSDEMAELDNKIGIEPLSREFSYVYFKNLLTDKNSNIKSFLLDQKFIAGLGNIYVDEALFLSRISPYRRLNTLNNKEILSLHRAIKNILAKAIFSRGTTFNDYVDASGNKGSFLAFLNVYQRDKKKCKRCKKENIKKVKIAGRGTRYCPACQK